MSDSDEDEIDPEDEPFFAEMADISDVTIDMPKTRSRKEVLVRFKSKENDFNLMRLFLAVEAYYLGMKHEIGVMEDDRESH